jgi:hypothetical protein
MKKKMKLYTVTIREEKETPVFVRANTEDRAVDLAHGLYSQRPDDRRVNNGNDESTTWVKEIREVDEK